MDFHDELDSIFNAIDEGIKIRGFEIESCIFDLEREFKKVDNNSFFDIFFEDEIALNIYNNMKKGLSIAKELNNDLKSQYQDYVDDGEIDLEVVLGYYKKFCLIFGKLDDMRNDLSFLNSLFNTVSSD